MKLNKYSPKTLALLGVLAIVSSGCASITQGSSQLVSVKTMAAAGELKGALCVVSNDKGKWAVNTPGTVTINKSAESLSIKCRKAGYAAGKIEVESRSGAAIWGNLALGGPVGAIVDRQTGAAFNYPDQLQVTLTQP
ncbi:MAG: hypothetical protein ACK4FF_01955 [Limnobacter sp.]|uniref:hypothetical protein n=1 Tax=Limnobacter sp. TaxID=2003368 RepID=UPI00391B73CA